MAFPSGGPLADDAVETGYDYDLIVIGGGSGGLAASKEAAALGKKVAVFDFVKPSPAGTSWGLGGTCVNVGCIPKKLMHQAGLHGGNVHDAKSFGWNVGEPTHDWGTMVSNVQDHIGSLNWGYKVQLRDKGVTYKNEFAKFMDAHTVETEDKRGRKKTYTSRRFVIACGGRPTYDDHIDPSLYITSDDLFSLEKPPGKTLVVGASYVALECAGFISHLGMEAHVMMRSIPLRGFDQQMSNMIVDYMEGKAVDADGNTVMIGQSEGGEHRPTTTFIKGAVVDTVEALPDGTKKVTWKASDTGAAMGSDTYDTILYAIGRKACTDALSLETVGVVTEPNGKMKTTCEQTNVPHVYAIGDVIYGQLELTPVAIQAGRLLARRLFGGSTMQMDYDQVPTTVFTPIEYGCAGLAEEDAIAKFGEENLEVFHSFYQPLEWTVPHKQENACYMKMICNKLDSFRVIGFHVLGPNAGEITQGVGVAIKCGATKEDFDNTVGIHPTIGEEVTTLEVTKSSGVEATKSGC
jgi:thioredoxin reductase (NADPH)